MPSDLLEGMRCFYSSTFCLPKLHNFFYRDHAPLENGLHLLQMVLEYVRDLPALANVTVGTSTGKGHPCLVEDATSHSREDLAAKEVTS